MMFKKTLLVLLVIPFKVESLTLLQYQILIAKYRQIDVDEDNEKANNILNTIETNAIEDINNPEIYTYLKSKGFCTKLFMLQEIINALCNDQAIVDHVHTKLHWIFKLTQCLCPIRTNDLEETLYALRKKCLHRLKYLNKQLVENYILLLNQEDQTT